MSSFLQIPDSTSAKTGGIDALDASLQGTWDRVRRALKQDLAECGLSREEVAVRLSERGGRVSVALIDAYVAESKHNRFPAELIPAWIAVTKSRRILTVLCGEVGLSIATDEDRDFADLGRAHLKATRLMTKLSERA